MATAVTHTKPRAILPISSCPKWDPTWVSPLDEPCGEPSGFFFVCPPSSMSSTGGRVGVWKS